MKSTHLLADSFDLTGKFIVLPYNAERALAPLSPSTCGIFSIANSPAIGSIENPHLNDEPGAIIAFPGKTSDLIPG